MKSNRGVKRRDLLKGIVAAGVAGIAGGEAGAQEKPDSDAITTADIAAADKLAGRAYTETERAPQIP